MGLKEDLEIVMNMKPLGHKPNLAPQAKRLSEDRLLFDAEDLSMMKHTAQRRQWLQEEANIQIVNLVDQCTTLMQREAALAAQKEQVRELVEAARGVCDITLLIATRLVAAIDRLEAALNRTGVERLRAEKHYAQCLSEQASPPACEGERVDEQGLRLAISKGIEDVALGKMKVCNRVRLRDAVFNAVSLFLAFPKLPPAAPTSPPSSS